MLMFSVNSILKKYEMSLSSIVMTMRTSIFCKKKNYYLNGRATTMMITILNRILC